MHSLVKILSLMKSASFIPVMSTVWYVVASLEMRMMTGLRESTVFGGLISCVARDVSGDLSVG